MHDLFIDGQLPIELTRALGPDAPRNGQQSGDANDGPPIRHTCSPLVLLRNNLTIWPKPTAAVMAKQPHAHDNPHRSPRLGQVILASTCHASHIGMTPVSSRLSPGLMRNLLDANARYAVCHAEVETQLALTLSGGFRRSDRRTPSHSLRPERDETRRGSGRS